MHPSTARNMSRYHRRRQELLERLGNQCQIIPEELEKLPEGKRRCSGELHIDHPQGRRWEARALSSHLRVERYWAEREAGVEMRLLCKRHNGWDGSRRREERKRGGREG